MLPSAERPQTASASALLNGLTRSTAGVTLTDPRKGTEHDAPPSNLD